MQQLEGAIHDLEAVSVDLQTLKKSSLTEIQSLVSSVGSLSEGFKSVPNALPLQDLPKGIPDDNSIVEKDVLAAELKAIKLKYERVYKRLKSQESANLLLNDKLKEAQEEIKISKDQLMNGKNVAKHTSWDHLIASVHQDSELIRGIQEQLIHSMETHSKNNFISISEHQLLQEQFAICIRQKSEGAVLCKTLTETVQEQSNELNSLKQCKSELQKQLDEIMHRYDKASKSVDYLKIQCNKVVSELNSKNAMMKNLSESLRKAELIAKEETKEKLALSQYNEELKRRLMQLEEAVKEQVKVPSHSPQSENLQDETNMGEKRHKRATRDNERDSLLSVGSLDMTEGNAQKKQNVNESDIQSENKPPENCFYCHEPTRGLTLTCVNCKSVLHLKCLKEWSANHKLTSPTNAREFMCDKCMKKTSH